MGALTAVIHPGAAGLVARVREARGTVAELEAALQRPGLDLWDRVAPRLRDAAALLASVERELGEPGALPLELRAHIRSEIQGLARDLRRLQALMRAAADFYTGWGQLLCATLAGYTPAGTVAALPAPARVSFRG